ncbi:exlusion protein FxsA [Vibrio cholerae]|nr:exlusion protein FxsA [Vibrio cholerae]MCD1227822.1 exlusion protein FxsA [Vibrio cholerae]MCD1231361.1 exlusion protein FxsA [Vibrio cholerae]
MGKQWATKLTNASKGLPTRSVFSPNEPRWLQLLCLSLVVMRCQPLRRALNYKES